MRNEPDTGLSEVRIERTMRAPPERVFRAFLEPALIREWMSPSDLDIDEISVDPRVGGKILVLHSRNGESTGSFQGEFVKIVPNRELVYRWAFVGTEPEKGEFYDTLVTVTFRPVTGGHTKVVVLHAKLEQLHREVPQIYAQVEREWTKSLDLMGRALEKAGMEGTGWPRQPRPS